MILVCAAWQEEIKYLDQNIEHQVITLGIGYLEAALNLESFLNKNPKPKEIIFIGTAGSYSQALSIGELVNVSSVSLLNIGTVLKQSYIPKEYESFQSSGKIQCLSSLEITNSAELSKKISNLSSKSLVENMELYGVAKVASRHDIPWSAILGITNYTDENAHQDWKANHQRVSADLCKSFTNTNLLHN